MEYCDANEDGTLTICEIHDCLVMCENEWRLENCEEGTPDLYCEYNPFEPCEECPGMWICEDVYMISEDFLATADTNGDG